MISKRFQRSPVLFFAMVVATAFWTTGSAFGQKDFPTKPIEIQVGFSAGGSTDMINRALGKAASPLLGQSVVIINSPGGGGTVALANLMKARPDGYTLGSLTTGAVAAQYMRDVPFKVMQDFTPVIHMVSFYAGLVVKSDSPWKDFKAFVEYAKANPKKIRYSTAGPGMSQHLVMERLGFDQGIDWIHVPYGGGVEAVTALLGGHVEAASQVTEWKPYVDAGNLRLLAVYGETRMPQYPDVPTLKELGYNISMAPFIALVAPKGTPPERVQILAKAFQEAMKDPEVNRVREQFFMASEYKGPEPFKKYLEKFDGEMESLLRKAGLMKK